jgi:glycosyltransferase involved in cell wall biosynthesis
MHKPLVVALITPDLRDDRRQYSEPQPVFGYAPTALLQGLGSNPECEVHIVSCVQRPVASPEKVSKNTFYHSVKVGKWGWLRGAYAGSIVAVRRKLRQIKPDIVHGQGTERYCALCAVFSGFPNVITIHGNMRMIARANHARPFSFLWLAGQLEGFTLPRTDGVVCITRYTQRAVEHLARRTWVLPNAVDASFFDVQAAPDPDATPVVLCVGTVCPLKNQNAFIRALDPLAKEKKFKLVFLGQPEKGAYGQKFLQLVRERPWCEHVGFVNREQLMVRLKTATFLALPTLEDNCPMVVLEAMAAGVPVLASKVGGVPDLIEHEKTGLFCAPERPESFREGVAKLLAGREFAQQLAAAARVEALRRFHPQVIAGQHLEIYREVINTRTVTVSG